MSLIIISFEVKLSNNYTTIERSIKGEDYAQFQPQGELIAYSSATLKEENIRETLVIDISLLSRPNLQCSVKSMFLFHFDFGNV